MSEKKEASKKDSPSNANITKEEKELGLQSNAAYQKSEYKKCFPFLKKLHHKRPEDVKVLNNYGLVEFYLSGSKNSDKFKEIFQRISKLIATNSKADEKIEDVDNCIIHLNQAVLYYHLHLYNAAINILDKIFIYIEPLDSSTAREVCFLLIDLYLCTCRPEKALGLINYVDKALFSTNENSNKKSDKDKDGKEKQAPQVAKSDLKNDHDVLVLKPKLLHLKVKSYIMLKSMKACRREAKNLMACGNTIQATYMKANTEYVRNNFKKAMRLLNSHPVTQPEKFAETGENALVYYNNNLGCMNVYLGKPNIAQLHFNKAFQELSSQYAKFEKKSFPLIVRSGDMQHHIYYNLGLALLFSDKPEAAFEYLMKAVKVFRKNPRLWLRIAECCIRVHKLSNECDFKTSSRKIDIVKEAIGAGPHRKLILSTNNNKENTLNYGKSKLVKGPNLQFANVCLNTATILMAQHNFQTDSNASTSTKPASGQTPEQEKAASPSQAASSSTSAPSASAEPSVQYIPAFPANPIYGAEIASLRISILTASCYVNLALDNPLVALHQAEDILSQPKVSPRNKYLAHMYAGEALIKLSHVADAMEHLNVELFNQDVNILSADVCDKGENSEAAGDANASSSSVAHKENEKITNNFKGWYPNTCATARNAMKYNQTVANTLLGNLDVASINLKQIADAQGPSSEMPVHAVSLAMYLQLRLGHADVTRNMIRQKCPQYHL